MREVSFADRNCYGDMYFDTRIAMIVLPEKERNTKHQQIWKSL